MLEDVSRALLVECINADQFPGQIAGIFPFLKGWLQRRGATVRWVRYGISTANLHAHGRDAVTLDAEELDVLLRVAAELRPDTLVLTHALWEDHVAALQRVVPDVRLVPLAALEGHMAWEHDRGDLVPDYRFEAGNEAAARPDRQNVYVMVRDGCGYRRSIASNPCYADVLLPEGIRAQGCAFCGMKSAELARTGQRTRDWLALQLRAIHADHLAAGRPLNALLFENVEQPDNLEFALRTMAELGLTGAKVLVGARTDRLVQLADVLREWLAEREDTDAALHVFVSGLENFSGDELLRMNKGTTPLDGVRAVNLVQELELRYPRNFNYSGYAPFSVIFFTPWTTFADLHLNLRLVQHLGIEAQVGNLFMARLRLHPDVAMTFLARRDGLLVDDVADPALRLNRRKLFREEQAWRFRDPRLEPVNRIATRLEADTAFEGDPLHGRVQEALHRVRAADPTPDGRSADAERRRLVALLLAIVDVARGLDDPQAPETLLDAAVAALVERARAARPVTGADEARGPAPSFRVGETPLPPGAWLTRVLPLVGAGHVPVLTVDGLTPASAAALDPAVLRAAGLEYLLETPRDGVPGVLHVARERAAIARRSALDRALRAGAPEERQAALEEAARLAGAPACCARAWATSGWARAGVPGWAALALRLRTPGALPASCNPLLLPGIAFYPCGPACETGRRRLSEWTVRLGLATPEDLRVHLFPLDRAAPDELVALTPVSREPRGLRYDAAAIAPGDDPLRTRLRQGDRLRFVPGQVQLWSHERLVETWSASVGAWDPQRSVDGAFWTALAEAALRHADPEAREAAARATAEARRRTADARLRTAPAPSVASASPAPAPAAESGPDGAGRLEEGARHGPEDPARPERRVPAEGGEGLARRAGTLRIEFVDRRGDLPEMVFFLGQVRDTDPTVARVGQLGLAHAPCPTGKAFRACVEALEETMRAIPTAPSERNRLAWERAIHKAVGRTALGRRFHCEVDQL